MCPVILFMRRPPKQAGSSQTVATSWVVGAWSLHRAASFFNISIDHQHHTLCIEPGELGAGAEVIERGVVLPFFRLSLFGVPTMLTTARCLLFTRPFVGLRVWSAEFGDSKIWDTIVPVSSLATHSRNNSSDFSFAHRRSGGRSTGGRASKTLDIYPLALVLGQIRRTHDSKKNFTGPWKVVGI